MKRSVYLLSSDGKTNLHVNIWSPETAPRAVLQIVHGMEEHIERYDEFARFLNENGVAVVGNDMIGHGKSVNSPEDYGFFAETNGKTYLLNDIRKVGAYAKKQFPGVPLFLLGFSMGSFLVRRYITKWGDSIDGVIIAATGYFPEKAANFGKFLAWTNIVTRGARSHSYLLDFLSTGMNAVKFKLKGNGSWQSKNTDSVKAYKEDPKCGFHFTTSAIHTLYSVIEDLGAKKDFGNIPKDLPILLASGLEDPLGNGGKGVLTVYNQFVRLGIRDLNIQLYPNDRHEILNETDRDVVYNDILYWMEQRI